MGAVLLSLSSFGGVQAQGQGVCVWRWDKWRKIVPHDFLFSFVAGSLCGCFRP
jgi:hypothetical protein